MGHHGVPQWGHGSIWGRFGPIWSHFGPFWVLLSHGLVQLCWDTTSMLPSHSWPYRISPIGFGAIMASHSEAMTPFGAVLVPFGILLSFGLVQLGSDTKSMLPSHS